MSLDVNIQVIQQILDDDVSFYTDALNEEVVYVEYPLPNGAQCFTSINNKKFQAFLSVRYCEQAEEDLCPPDIFDYLENREQREIYTQEHQVSIHRRIKGSIAQGEIYYFLSDVKWRSVRITPSKWRVGQSRTCKFLRSAFDEAQVEPVNGGDLLTLLKPFVNLDNDNFLLFVAFLVQSFSRSSSHYAAVISSSKGTGKSTLTKLIRSIVDPSASSACLTPTNEGDLKNSLANSYLACFDNTAALTNKFSDILCAAITGTKEAKRKLYTDCDQVVLSLHNLVVINGIDIVPRRSDLADRSLFFEMLSISPSKRRTDAELWGDFACKKPQILGAVFDVLKEAMNILPTLTFSHLARMADAYKEMTAIAVALGVEQSHFEDIFKKNEVALQESYSQCSPFLEFVLDYLQGQPSIDKPAKAIFQSMKEQTDWNMKFFPDSPSALSRKLSQEKDALLAAGYEFSRYKKQDANHIVLRRIPKSQQTKEQREYSNRQKLLAEGNASM